jgi:hypothetical protein
MATVARREKGARSFAAAVRALRRAAGRFDEGAAAAKAAALGALGRCAPALSPTLVACHDALLFMLAHPTHARERAAVEHLLARIARTLHAARGRLPPAFTNTGLPFAPVTTRFSHDALRWLLAHPNATVAIDGLRDATHDCNAVLALTLPALERHVTSAGHDADGLFAALRVPRAQRLRFLVDQVAAFDAAPFVKDQLFDALGVWVTVRPRTRALAKAYNRLPPAGEPFFHPGVLLKRFDVRALLDSPLPAPRVLDDAARAQVVQVLKDTMLLTARETDPATYLDVRSLAVHDLERGLTVATFGMRPARQMPLESYVGFTLFKNGLPAAYGGSWVFGRGAEFGMNIFEPYRGGESGYMMCQVLRTYRQRFGVERFEVDAYQFGRDNEDGIASGAFWFYHRHGFRPVDPALARLAAAEHAKIARGTGYRSSARTLVMLAGSNVALHLGSGRPPKVHDLTAQVTRWIASAHRGDRAAALADARSRFAAAAGIAPPGDADGARVFDEVALLAMALDVGDERRLGVLAHMVGAKPANVDEYQALVSEFLRGTPP